MSNNQFLLLTRTTKQLFLLLLLFYCLPQINCWLLLTKSPSLSQRRVLVVPQQQQQQKSILSLVQHRSNNINTLLLLFSTTNGWKPAPSNNNNDNKSTKKVKKNKYANFSKTQKQELDPFETLLEESKQKLETLKEQETLTKKKSNLGAMHNNAMDQTPNKLLDFPNNKDINPYDPTTFGFIEIATIIGPHGVHGWFKVKADTDFPERLTRPGTLLHMKRLHKRAPRKVILAAGKKIQKDAFLIQLQGVYDRDAAAVLKGATLYYATQQDELDHSDEYLVSDLVNLAVKLECDETTTTVGVVQGVVLAEEMCSIPELGHDFLEIKLTRIENNNDNDDEEEEEDDDHEDEEGGKKDIADLVLIPLVPEIVPIIDLESKEIFIIPPDGLLDLTYVKEEKVRIKGLLAPANY